MSATQSAKEQDTLRSKETLRIGTLDTETCGLSSKSVVWEAAVIILECDQHYQRQNTIEHGYWRLDMFEQLAKGRTVNADTMAFHKKNMGDSYSEIFNTHSSELRSVGAFFRDLKVLCEGLDEMWINGNSFDVSMLKSLALDFGLPDEMPWRYRGESDLRTIRTQFNIIGLSDTESTPAHRAIEDCKWNLRVLSEYGMWLKTFQLR